MKNYGIEMEGKFYLEQLASVPGWDSSDESRIVYDQTTDKLYFGDGADWVRIATYSEVDAVDSIEAGTKMLFSQASAPTGWVRDETYSHVSDKRTIMLAANGGAGVTPGGSYDLVGRSISHVHTTPSHQLTTGEIPSHNHSTDPKTITETGTGDAGGTSVSGNEYMTQTGYTGGGGTHNHGNTGTAGETLNPRYLTIIIASRS